MGMARIGEGQHEAADIRLLQSRQDVFERHVAIVRRFGIAPAHMEADAVARNVAERLLMVATTCSTNSTNTATGLSL